MLLLQSMSFFEHGRILKEINKTVVTLIPKSDDAKCVKDCRLIVGCTNMYKIISKVLTA